MHIGIYSYMPNKLVILPWDTFGTQKIICELDKKPNSSIRRFSCECMLCRKISDKFLSCLLQSKTWCNCVHSKWSVKPTDSRSIEEKKLRAVFSSMKQRCSNKKHKFAYIYSLKWIKCEWKNFGEFYKDMWPTYKIWLSIDRIDWNKNYCKENCRWADIYTQNNNRDNNIIMGNWLTLAQWCRNIWMSKSYSKTAFEYYKKWLSEYAIIEKYKEYCFRKDMRIYRKKNNISMSQFNRYLSSKK